MSRRLRFLHHTFRTLSPWVSMKTGQLLPERLHPHLWVFSVPASPQCILTVPDFPSLSVLFSSVAQSCPTLCDPMDCSMPGLPVHHQPPEMPSNHLILCRPCFSLPQPFPASGSFHMSQFFTSGGQNIGVSASASVLPMNIQD